MDDRGGKSKEESTRPISQGDMCRMMDMLAHDIDNYISATIGYLDILEHQLGPAGNARGYTEKARSSSLAVSNSVEKLRMIMQARTEPLDLEGVDLVCELEEALSKAGSRATSEPQVDNELKDDPLIVKGDRFIKEMFAELFFNSFKAAGSKKPWLGIALEQNGDGITVSVEDRSGGMSDEEKARAPLRFRNLLEKDDHHGSGLGLSMVYEIATRYGWGLRLEDRVEGKPAEGLRVVLTIPIDHRS